MAMKPIFDKKGGNETRLVDKVVGNAYGVVRLVAEHLEEIKKTVTNMGAITQAPESAHTATEAMEEAKLARDASVLAKNASLAAQIANENIVTRVESVGNRILGSFDEAPTHRNDGSPLEEGDQYFDTTSSTLMVYDGLSWFTPNVDGQDLGSSEPGKGSALVGFKQAGVGAVSRTLADKVRESVSVRDFGAVGDGIADDTAAIQKAIDSALEINGVFGDVYRITTELVVPPGRSLDFKWAVLKRDFPNGYCLKGMHSGSDGAASDENITVRNVKFRDFGRSDGSDFGAALRFSWAENILIDGIDVLFTSTQPTLMYGAWAVYLSGKNITARNITIDNVKQGQQADGLHFGYLKNVVISDFNIRSGDDCISLVVPPEGWTFEGLAEPSENIIIGNGYCSSPLYAALKLGAHNNAGNPAPANSVYRNVLFHDIVIGPVGSAPIILEDKRRDPNINDKHDNITFDNIRVADQTNAYYTIAIFGDETSTDPAYRATKNFGRVTFRGVQAEQGGTPNNLIQANSVEKLTFINCDIGQEFDVATGANSITFSHIDNLVFQQSQFRTHSTANGVRFSFVKNIGVFDTVFNDIGNGFRGLEISFNTEFPVSFVMINGGAYGYQRALAGDNSAGATDPLRDFILDGADLNGTFVDIASISAPASGLDIRNLRKRLVSSTGGAGGSGSAGEGNQYIALTIGGTTYKVLHDGTV